MVNSALNNSFCVYLSLEQRETLLKQLQVNAEDTEV